MATKIILLDIDGVLVTNQNWKPVEELNDGFMAFSNKAARSLNKIILETSADIILTSSHRRKYSNSKWNNIFEVRGIHVNSIRTLEDVIHPLQQYKRLDEIVLWVNKYGFGSRFVIIDDDSILDNLPYRIKERWIKTRPLVGLDEENASEAISILNNLQAYSYLSPE